MLIRYPDQTGMWRCDRCGAFHSKRLVILTKVTPAPPYGWSGDACNTLCAACVSTVLLEIGEWIGE